MPESIALDSSGDLYIADTFNNRIQEVPAASGSEWGQSMTAGDIYTVAGSSSGTAGSSGDGGAVKSALLHYPCGIATDAAGDVFIADFSNDRVQEMAVVTGTQRGTKMTGGDMYTIAGTTGSDGLTGDGGKATAGLLDDPTSVAADVAGDVYIADSLNNRVQEVPAGSGTQWSQSMTAGDIYTVAGSATGAAGDSGDGGPATSALMNNTEAVSLDPAGDLYVTDLNNNRLREVVATTSTTISPAPGQTSSLAIAPAGAAPGGITITQPGGAQVTFYSQNDGSCASPYVAAGQYCVMPQDVGVSLSDNTSIDTYTFTPSSGSDSYTYSWAGQLKSVADPAGDSVSVAYQSPAPGSAVSGDANETCPSSAASCETVTSASGRELVIGSDSSDQVTSVTDPMGREWTYAYNSAGDLASATDPMGNETSYTYGSGSTGQALQANDLLTITSPNAQPGGPDAGDASVNVYNASNQVISQTDPMGYATTFGYCVNQSSGNCMDASTGTGFVTVSDPDGNSTVYDFDQGVLAAESQWTGTTLTSEQDYGADTTEDGTDAAGTLQDVWATDGDGTLTTYSYDSNGDTVAVTSPIGTGSQTATTTAWYNGGNESCSATAEAATPCSASLTGPSPVTPGGVITPPSSAPPSGVTYTLYDSYGNELYSTTGVYQPGSGSASYQSTSYTLYKGDSVTLPGASSATTCTSTPPSPTLPCATIDPDGNVTQLTYDAAGDLTQSSVPDGNGSQLSTTTYGYDGDGDQTSAVAPDGNVPGASAAATANYTTDAAYNADGEKTSVTQAAGAAATVTPRVTDYGYDGDGNQTTVTDARGYTMTTAYNADDQATVSTDPDGNQTLTCYDGDGNVTQTVPPSGVAAGSLSAASCPTSYPSGYGDRLAADATTTTYDAAGDPTTVTSPAPAGQSGYETTTTSYDGAGNAVKVTAPAASSGGAAQVTVSAYNAANQLVSQTTGYGTAAVSTTSYCYDPDGDTTSVVMPDGNTSGTAACQTSSPWAVSASAYPAQAGYQTTSAYDSAGELVSSTSPATAAAPSGATTTSTYDPAGNQLTSTDPDGVTTTWTYTPDGNTATVAYSGSAAHSVSYAYDADGSQTQMTDGTGTSSYTWDPFGELTSQTSGAGATVGYSYDADGDTTGITYPLPASAAWAASDTVTYGYDKADTLTSVTDFNGNQIAITSNADSLPTSETLGSTGDTVTTSYDPAGSPSAIMLKNSSSALQSFTYSDAPDGSITSETDVSATSAAYTYDGRGQVASMTIGSSPAQDYGFDASGNLTTLPGGATGSYDDDSELTSSTLAGATTSYTYNADGDRTGAAQGTTTTSAGTWNGADELTAYTSPAADMSAAAYDGNGVRASAAFIPSGGTATTQNYTWDTAGSTPQLLMDSGSACVSFRHAVELLRDGMPAISPAGRAPGRSTVRRLASPLDREAADDELLGQVADYYHRVLKESPDALGYLARRKIDHPEAVDTFRLGYSDRTLGLRLPGKRRRDGADIRGRLTRLGIYRASGHEHFAGSLVIPVHDEHGNMAEVYGRKIRDDLRAGTPAHLYLPGPHRGVWNLAALAASDEIIVCESLIDALTFWCAGFRHVTASFGAGGFTADHQRAFAEHQVRRALIAYDRDDAGDRAARELAADLTAGGVECFRIEFPAGADANDVAVASRNVTDVLGRAIRSAAWMGTGPGPARRRNAPLPVATPAVAPEPEPASLSAAASSAVAEPQPAVVTDPAAVSPAPVMADEPAARLTGREVMLAFGERRWRVRGLDKASSFEVLRVNVMASVPDGPGGGARFHVDTLDLYSARARAVFTAAAAAELGLEPDVVKRDLGRVLLACERLADEAVTAAQTPQAEQPMSDADRAAALSLLRDPALADRITADFAKTGMAGESVNCLTGYLAAIPRKLPRPLAVIVQSTSAAGKSALMDAVLAFVPPEERVRFSAMTGQSLFYMGESDLAHKVLAVAEEEGAERAAYALKLLSSDGQLSIASTGKDTVTGRLVTHTYTVTVPAAIFLTTTAIDVDEELLNRCVVLTVDEGRAQTKAIHHRQRAAQTLDGLLAGIERDQVMLLHQNAQRLLEPLAVVNPHAGSLTFADATVRARREHVKYLTLIAAIALLHQHQRQIKTITRGGSVIRYVEAAPADIELADRLAAEVLSRSLDELPPGTRKLLEALHGYVTRRCQEEGLDRDLVRFTRRQLRETLSLGDTQLKVHLARLADYELVIPHRTDSGRFCYELARSAADAAATADRSGSQGLWSAPGRPAVGGRSALGRPVPRASNGQASNLVAPREGRSRL